MQVIERGHIHLFSKLKKQRESFYDLIHISSKQPSRVKHHIGKYNWREVILLGLVYLDELWFEISVIFPRSPIHCSGHLPSLPFLYASISGQVSVFSSDFVFTLLILLDEFKEKVKSMNARP